MTRVWNWGKSMVAFVVGLVLLFTLYFAVNSRNHPSIAMFGRQWVAVDSTLLEPAIQAGALIMERQPMSVKSLQVGDILSYTPASNQRVDSVRTGRIQSVATRNGQLSFQVRSNSATQVEVDWVPFSTIVGIYGHVEIPYLGYYSKWMQTKVGVTLLVIVPGLFLMLMTFIRLIQEIMNLVPMRSAISEKPSFEVRTSSSSYGLEGEPLATK